MTEYVPRAAIVRELRQPQSNAAIARKLGCDKHRVGTIRHELGLPNVSAQPLTLEEKWQANTRPLEGGHLEWTGERVGPARTPMMRYKGGSHRPAAIAFRLQHGREPEGYVLAECGVQHCVAPDHVEDEPGRRQLREQLRHLLGGPEHKTHCINGHDLAVHVKYSPDGRTAYCGACHEERKQAQREAGAA